VSSPAVEVERLFLALLPDDSMRAMLDTLINKLPLDDACRKIPIGSVHVTLAFIGNFPVSQRSILCDRLSTVCTDSFELVFDRLSFRQRQQMLWLESVVPDALNELVVQLKLIVAEFGVAIDDRMFCSHMTLVKKLRRFSQKKMEFDPLVWAVKDFTLVRSKTLSTGAEYEPLETFHL